MPISTTIKVKRDGTLTIASLGGGAFNLATGALLAGADSLVVAYEAGDLSIEIPGPSVSHFLDRGRIVSPPSVRYGDDAPVTGSFSAHLRDLSDAAYATLEEILMRSGFVSTSWESSRASAAGAGDAEVFAVDLKWDVEGTAHGDATDHIIILPYCVLTGGFSEGDPNSIKVSFTAHVLYPAVIS